MEGASAELAAAAAAKAKAKAEEAATATIGAVWDITQLRHLRNTITKYSGFYTIACQIQAAGAWAIFMHAKFSARCTKLGILAVQDIDWT